MRVSDTVQIGHPQTEVRNPKSRGDDPSIEEDTLSLPLGRGPAAFPHGDMRLGPADRSASRCGTRALPGALPLAPPALARGCCMRGGCGKWREAAREGSQRDVRAVCAQCPAAAFSAALCPFPCPPQPSCFPFHRLEGQCPWPQGCQSTSPARLLGFFSPHSPINLSTQQLPQDDSSQ